MRLPLSSGKLNQPKPTWPFMLRRVSGHSMVPVLPPGILVFAYRWAKSFHPGDVIIFFHDGREKMKRIGSIEDNKVFVVGDHKEESIDSRHFGAISKSQIMGKIWWPRAARVEADTT